MKQVKKDFFVPLSFSSLNAFARSPLQFYEYKTGKRVETPAMRIGTLTHRAILEPVEYENTVVVYDGRRAGNAWKEFREDNAGKDIVTIDEQCKIEAMSCAVHLHSPSRDLLAECDQRERGVEFDFEGIPHRGFIDAMCHHSIVDLKITNNVEPNAIARVVWDRRYYMQAAIYAYAAGTQGYDVDECYILAVESNPPYHVRLYRLEPSYIERGAREWRRLLQMWKDWDGLPAMSHEHLPNLPLDAPRWAPKDMGFWDDQREDKGKAL